MLNKSKMTKTIKNNTNKEIDHIYMNQAITTIANLPEPFCSDHIPVVIES